MLLLEGKPVFSSFRLEKLLAKLIKKDEQITAISANYIYLVKTDSLSLADMSKLITIIDPCSQLWQDDIEASLFITPRLGTISPWSSKATDILQVCGLTAVERIERGIVYRLNAQLTAPLQEKILSLLHDCMTETYLRHSSELELFFHQPTPKPATLIPLQQQGAIALEQANEQLGLALSDKEINYLTDAYHKIKRDPTESELMMFAQINSEHCRHKIFNAKWFIAGEEQAKSLFDMIRYTYQSNPEGVLSAYKDNAAVLEGHVTDCFFADPLTKKYDYVNEQAHIVIKVETHNHPTAIAPFEGAATGAGGEIRDEGATGIGGKPKAGLVGFSVSHLNIPALHQPWETSLGYPQHVASALDIMIQGPIGAASFNNEFGRPTLCGYFRTFEWLESYHQGSYCIRGYHKPIMIAGGVGQIRPSALAKGELPIGAKLVVLGGPAMLIGLGGGAASSVHAGGSHQHLDFASVQRSNPEMERRCQEVLNECIALGKNNPIISIHDVGAGGLSNALPELVHDSNKGATFDLQAIPLADMRLSNMEIWCNEAQERYVLAISPADLPFFEKITRRERCPFAVVGEVNDSQQLILENHREKAVDVPLTMLFGEVSKSKRYLQDSTKRSYSPLKIDLPLAELIQRVLQYPCVADKSFLITIGDRSVTGLIARDQMVGPWQVPVADVAVTASGYSTYTGEAFAMGERTPLALLDAKASARMAIGEAITNILAAEITALANIKFSANWMAGANHQEENRNLYEAVQAVGLELCPALGICIPVGKDSLSMQMKWQQADEQYEVVAPLSLIISAFAPVTDIRHTVTPLLQRDRASALMLIDLGQGMNRLGGSSLAQVLNQIGNQPPDLNSPSLLRHFFNLIQKLRRQNLLLAYHDRSDGGLLATVCEMSFASHVGITLTLDRLGPDPVAILFNEELGAVIQYPIEHEADIIALVEQEELQACAHKIGYLNESDNLIIQYQDQIIYQATRIDLHRTWSATSYQLQALRDNPDCALQEYDALRDSKNPGLHAKLTFTIPQPPAVLLSKPRVAILREQGVNGHMEMAAAFTLAGFEAIDVHMTDIINGELDLLSFQGLVACGGFSYGDVLGAGRGWANSILYNDKARKQVEAFFSSPSIFVLGVCNGCQMLSHLKQLIPGASHWPTFNRNVSEQFEARLSLVKVVPSKSIFFQGMEESIIPIIVSHGEGRALFQSNEDRPFLFNEQLISLQYVDNHQQVTENYPANPNGSPDGIAAVTNEDGRFTIMMPHAERVFRSVQFSWHPKEWQEHSPWMKLFINAREWVK